MPKKVLLISPLEDFLLNPKEFPPLGILYLSSYLKQQGQEVDVLHGNIEDIKKEYDFYGISASTVQYPKANLFLQYIKQKQSGAKVILGGAHTIAPRCSKEALEDGFDYVVVGQGEKAFLKIIEGKENGGIIVGEPLNQEELDTLLPDREAINILEYGYPLEGGRAATMITARGCPYRCSFCSISSGRVMFRTAEKVLEEIGILKNKYGFDKLLFLDDSFTVNRERLIKVLNGMKNLGFKYRCYARSDNSNDRKLLELMRESGCVEIGVGIESGSQKILDLTDKKTKVDKNVEFIRMVQEVGIKVNAFVMIGLPGESRETIRETRRFMEMTKPERFGYNIFTPHPDSDIVINYEKLFTSGPHKGKSFKDFITIYPMPYEKAITKSESINDCFISTPDLSRQDITDAYHEEFEKFVKITGFDPRKRGERGKSK
nr:ribosomal protein S12 methylthiotransferase RimO [uncultured archaeon]